MTTPAAFRHPVTATTCFLFSWTGVFFLWWLLAFSIRGLMVLWEDINAPQP